MADDYLAKLLGDGEQVLYVDRQHWFVLVRNIIVEGVAVAAVLVLYFVLSNFFKGQPWANWIWLILILLVWPVISGLFDFFNWYNRKFIVTSWRVIQLSGIINKAVIDSSLEKVNDIELNQSFFGRIFGFGDVEILTASEIGANKFMTIRDPLKFKNFIVNAKERLGHDDDHRSGVNAGPAVQSAPAPADIPAMIDRLADLRKRGVLTEEEFQRSKQQLLQKMAEQNNSK
ncbi:MAG TPA: PH domain-containing protein [Anaerolineaceae bacterium]|jgi:Bacterial PH domain/Short C-terminal domain